MQQTISQSEKTHCILFTNGKVDRNIRICFNGNLIEQVETCKFLGVIVDSKLSWKQHCHKIMMCLSRNQGILRKLKHELPSNILFSIYNTLSLPHLQYGILAWGNTYHSYINKLFIMQKKMLRIINNSHYTDHSAPLFSKYNTLSVFDLYKYHLGVLMYKFTSKNLPDTILSFFTKNTEIHCHNTRSASNLSHART